MLYQLIVYVPATNLEAVKLALFNAGAGRYQGYQECCWQVQGQGQFKPLSGANPTIGEIEKRSHVAEYRVEMICASEHLDAALSALKSSHPYEVPAFTFWPINQRL